MFPHLRNNHWLKHLYWITLVYIQVTKCKTPTNLHLLVLKVHFNERISNQVSEATSIVVAVGPGVVL